MLAYCCSVRGILAANIIACAFGLTACPAAYAQEKPPASKAEPAQAKPPRATPPAPPHEAAPDKSKAPVAEPAQPPTAQSKTPPAVTDTKAQEKIKEAETPAKEEKKEEHEPADPDTGTSTLSPETLGLLPNPYERQGIKFTLSYVADALANVDGGLKRGAVYDGRLNGAIDLDLAKLAGAPGLVFHANAFQIHGPGLSRDYIGNLMPVSSIEALATTRLYEAWFEQKFWNDKFSIRAGQLAADAEFITSQYTDPFTAAPMGGRRSPPSIFQAAALLRRCPPWARASRRSSMTTSLSSPRFLTATRQDRASTIRNRAIATA
jgi:hypothetical protein